jgi:hypothetical protein
LRGHPSFALGIEGRVDPFLEWRTGEQAIGLALAAALETDSDHDAWGGAGLLLTMPLRRGSWRLEFSFMPGLYAFGIGEDLGKHTLVYRSQFGISRGCATRWRIGLSLGHKSNGGTAEKNPGSETVLLAMHRVF